MPPKFTRDQPKSQSRHVSPERESGEGHDSGPSSLTPSAPHQWEDLLNPNLPPTEFEVALKSTLESEAEMERIRNLNKQELQSVIDVLGRYLETGDVVDGLRKQCFKSLCSMCAVREILPSPHKLEPGDLQRSEVPNDAGGFGEVWKGSYNERAVAIKRLFGRTAQQEKRRERFCREVIMWKRLSSPNTLPLIGAYMRGSELVMVSEWMKNGNVKQYLRQNPRVNKLSLLADVARGVVYLHSMNVVHGDLKGVNILVKDDESACLADFGLMSIVLGPETTDITTSGEGGAKGTYRWMGPELFYPTEFGLSRFQLTKRSDCYAFGMVIYEILSGKVPFEGIKQSLQVPLAVVKGVRPHIPEGVPPKMMEVWDIAQKCWSQAPADRPSFQTVLDKLDTFAGMETVAPFTLREPRPMQVKGQPSETTTEWQALSTGTFAEAAPPVVVRPQSPFQITVTPPPARVEVDNFATSSVNP